VVVRTVYIPSFAVAKDGAPGHLWRLEAEIPSPRLRMMLIPKYEILRYAQNDTGNAWVDSVSGR